MHKRTLKQVEFARDLEIRIKFSHQKVWVRGKDFSSFDKKYIIF